MGDMGMLAAMGLYETLRTVPGFALGVLEACHHRFPSKALAQQAG
jgi:hypothetical protein